jgi:hypothetical protein
MGRLIYCTIAPVSELEPVLDHADPTGFRIAVWWTDDKAFYTGSVKSVSKE